MIRHLAILIAVAACGQRRTTGSCVDPAAYGAIPDDGVSDRDAFQRALELAEDSTLCIGPGRWTMTRAKIGTYNRFAALSTHGHGVTIAGAGTATVLELVGDQGAGAVSVISVDAGASGIVIRDLTIDTTGATNTDEQTHAIATSGNCSAALGTCRPITGLTITRIAFVHPRASGGTRKGDCIRLLGNTVGTAVSGVVITDITAAVCARAFVELQRGLTQVAITNNHTQYCGDQCIDSEPTGDGTARDEDITITGNTFDCAESEQGDADVSLGGIVEPARRVTMTGNTLCRGVSTYRIADSMIGGNAIGGAVHGAGGVIEIGNVCSGLVVSGNTIGRTGSLGPMIRATPHSGGVCSGLTVRDNIMVQHTASHGIWLESVGHTQVTGNRIQWTAPAPTGIGIYDRATIAPIEQLQIANNTLIGKLQYGVYLSAAPFAFGAGIVVTGNAVASSIDCVGSGGFAPMSYDEGASTTHGCP